MLEFLMAAVIAAASTPAAAAGGRVQPGAYHCSGGSAGNMQLSFKAGGQYANAQGKAGAYGFDAASGRLTFTSGPWEGFFGRLLPGGKIGLSSKPDTTSYYMVCERR